MGRNWLRYRYAKFKCHDVLCTFSRQQQQIVDLSANDISDQFVSSPRPAPKMMGRWCDTIAQPHGKHIPTNGDARVSLQGCLSISPWSALCRFFFRRRLFISALCLGSLPPSPVGFPGIWSSQTAIDSVYAIIFTLPSESKSATTRCFIVDSAISVFMTCQSSATFGATPLSTS